MIDPQILHAIQGARKFVADELEVRERSYLPDPGPDEQTDLAEARLCLAELDKAAETVLAVLETKPLRMYLALKLLRAWNSGTAGYSADVVVLVNRWIDDGMKGPIPWPESPFFAEWAEQHGISNVRGSVGLRFQVKVSELTEGGGR